MLVDPACSNEMEEDKLKDVIAQHKLNIKYILFTHTHIDHIAGSEFSKKFIPKPNL
jgi:glyoxylase-like metal-dependent hydrolase (beta-lactamase superfamily II)